MLSYAGAVEGWKQESAQVEEERSRIAALLVNMRPDLFKSGGLRPTTPWPVFWRARSFVRTLLLAIVSMDCVHRNFVSRGKHHVSEAVVQPHQTLERQDEGHDFCTVATA